MGLLHDPHHDGSPLYVSDEAPGLDDVVRVRVRTHHRTAPQAVWVRTTYDAEPTYAPLTRAGRIGEVQWWEGDLRVHNPRTHYRFLLAYVDGTQRWLTGAGIVELDPPDTSDFVLTVHAPAPDWGRDAVVYQIFPDRFARSAAADDRETPAWAAPARWEEPVHFEGCDPLTPLQFFAGDLDGIIDQLDHLAHLGVDVLYTTPVFPAESNHRYNASTFDRVDDLLGGDDAYARLSAAVHERGWHILGDLTTNHTGDTHEWFRSAIEGPHSPHRGWYHLHPDGSYESWMGHRTLPKVNHTNPALRAAMVEGRDSVVGRWLQPPYDVDGWRIDVANMTGRLGDLDVAHDVARAVRATARELHPEPWVIGEHNHDASGDVDGDGWHGTMNYSGFSWPLWSWLRAPDTPARPFGRPLPVPRRGGVVAVETWRAWLGAYGWKATCASWNILGSHDSARIRTLVGDARVHRVAAGLQFTLPGVPMLFAGDEIGLEGVNGEDARRPMPWDRRESWDHATFEAYARLGRLRREHVGLRRGGLRWAHAGDDAIAYLREHPEGAYLVVARRAASDGLALPVDGLGATHASHLFGTEAAPSADLRATSGVLQVPPAAGPRLDVWRLT